MNNEYLNYKQLLDQRLSILVNEHLSPDNPLYEAVQYAISAPGKRIRGALTIAFCNRLSVPENQSLPFAEALELIHAYSLVHDDMPEMDNDDYRRGQLTCHKKFGADTALLAGDAILNLSIEHLLSASKRYRPECFLGALSVLYKAAGATGMLCGQALDKNGENHSLTLDELLVLHRAKTGQLLLAPVLIAEQLSATENEDYVNYCNHIGLAFQIKDDILDVEGVDTIVGKETGKDFADHKSTFVSVLGIDKAKTYLDNEIIAAKKYARNDPLLLWLADYNRNREK